MESMKLYLTALLVALLAASCGDGTSANDSDIDSGTDAGPDADTDTDADCECASVDDAYCLDDCVMMACDGCHFAEDDCCEHSSESIECYCDPGDLPVCATMDI
jgi:hypothetical protein